MNYNEEQNQDSSLLHPSLRKLSNKEDSLLEEDLTGSWEKKERSITAAAFVGLIGIGALYFNIQSILMIILMSVYQAIFNIELPDNIIERINALAASFKTPILITLVVSQYLFMLYPTVWIVKRWHTSEIKKYLQIRLCSLREIILAVLITVSLLPFCYYLSYLILEAFDIPEIFEKLETQLFTAHSTSEFILLVIVVAITPAICEEVFFRGYVQRTMERTLGAKSFIITGIIFGLFHMQPLSLITLSILGILFSFFFYRSKSIIPSSAAHFVNNFIAILFLYNQSLSETVGIPADGNVPPVWVILSILIATLLMIVYLKSTKGAVYFSTLKN